MSKGLNYFITEINQSVNGIKKHHRRIFDLMLEAQTELSGDEYFQLRKKINVDRSSINKIEKITSNRVVMNNLSILPVSWSSLHQLSLIEQNWLNQFIKNVIKSGSEEEVLQMSKLTGTDVKELRAMSQNVISDTSSDITSYVSNLIEPTYVSTGYNIIISLRTGVEIDAQKTTQVARILSQLPADIFTIRIENNFDEENYTNGSVIKKS